MAHGVDDKSSAVAEMGDCLATIDVGRKVGAAVSLFEGSGSLSNTVWPGPRPTSMPSGILIYASVWPQYTNVEDRQDRTDRQDRQQSDRIGRTVLYKRSPKNTYNMLINSKP